MLDKLEELPVISINDLKKIKEYKNNKSFSLLIHRLKKKNKIIEIEKGKYTVHSEPYLVATNIITPSYLSFWSCSFFLGFTEQIVNTIQIACPVKKKPIYFMNQKIEFIKIPKKLIFGFKRNKNSVFIANNEKLVIDCLLLPEHVGNLDEIIEVIENAEINEDIIIEYIKKINNRSLIKKIGFLLEKYKSMDLFKHFKNNITKDKNYVTLPFSKGKNINKKWRVKHDYKE
ncbi:MAG: hypothetical protein ABIG89_05175 [Candidatus Woesearchaeota archaeon]